MKKIASGILPVIAVDRKSSKPLHQQIYDAYREAIASGTLRPGQRIPSTRLLAKELGVSRVPVLNAYAQLLAEGYLESVVGAGTIISRLLPEQFTSTAPARGKIASSHAGPRPVARQIASLPATQYRPWWNRFGAFGVGQVAFDQFPIQVWSRLVARHSRDMQRRSFHYGDPMGSPALRESVAGYLRTSRSVHCEPEQVMIVAGSQQALEISARVLFEPGSRVWTEEPGYRFGQGAFALAGCKLVPVPVDSEGLDVAAGIRKCRTARGAMVTPSHQFPLGMTMSASRRLQLLSWAHSNGAWILEDDYDSEYRYESPPIPSLQGMDVNARVLYIGTFSKVLFPALRLGYIVIPTDLVRHFVTARIAMDLGSPNLHQEVLADFMRSGDFERHIRRMRILYRERRSMLVDCIQKELAGQMEIVGAQAGMHLAVTFPAGISDVEIAQRAALQNLWIWPLSSTYQGAAPQPGLILGFGSTRTADIPRAVRKLRELVVHK
ncbi:MAG TPA: PLP-dependent aminotransferase family protein [Acidobacteriaceae bacterium]